MVDDRTTGAAVSLRERVKYPPAQTMIDSYFMPAIAAGLRFQFAQEMRVHIAHALMISKCGIVPSGEVARILKVLVRLREAGPDILPIDYQQEDVYSYVERHIIGELGPETGGRLHTGRSRNDLHTTTWRLALREKLLELMTVVNRLRGTMIELAASHIDTVMPGYTHTQHAQPISFGYYLLSAADLVARDFRRLSGALACCNRSPLGSGALSTTAFPIDRAMTRDFLGFDGLVEIAYDGVSSRDDVHEAAAALAVLMTGISRVATDLQTWNTSEYGFIELSDAYSTVSSIMPQKKNPQALEHVKGIAALATGALTTVLACSKNTAFADVNDGVSALNVPALEAIDRSTKALAVFEGTVASLKVRPETMRRAAEVGFGTATELADLIVRETGMSFRMAHNVVGRVVREAIEAGQIAVQITGADLDAVAHSLFGHALSIPEEKVRVALDPAENILARTITGGPAPARMHEMLDRRRLDLATDRQYLAAVEHRIELADAALDESVRQALGESVEAGSGDQNGTR